MLAAVRSALAQDDRNSPAKHGKNDLMLIVAASSSLRLQPELDQAADGFGAIKFHVLTCDPLVD
jgi:hypothetical protein